MKKLLCDHETDYVEENGIAHSIPGVIISETKVGALSQSEFYLVEPDSIDKSNLSDNAYFINWKL